MAKVSSTLAPFLMAGLALAGCSSCAKSRLSNASSAGDGGSAGAGGASADAAARPLYSGPFEIHTAARVLSWSVRLVPLADGRTALDAGVFHYELKPDGLIQRIGDIASYAAAVPADDDEIAGYDVKPNPPPDHFAGALAPPGELEMPPGTSGGRTLCERVASWGHAHVLCRWRDTPQTTLFRWTGDRWEERDVAQALLKQVVTVAAAKDETLWLGLSSATVVRVSESGSLDQLDFAKLDPSFERPSYVSDQTLTRRSRAPKGSPDFEEGDILGIQRFERLSVDGKNAPQDIDRISQIVPLADGEAWVIAHEQHNASVLFHISRPAMAPEAIVIGTTVDQRNEVRNLRPPRPWLGHCPVLFVALARQRADGTLASASLWARERSLSEMVKKEWADVGFTAPRAALVEGHFAGRRVAGVLVWRSEPTSSAELVEKAVHAISKGAVDTTGSAPDVFCNAPVLDRASPL